MSMQNDGSDPEKLEVPEFTDLRALFLFLVISLLL